MDLLSHIGAKRRAYVVQVQRKGIRSETEACGQGWWQDTRKTGEEVRTMHGYGSMWPMGGMMVGWLLLTVLIVGLVVWLVVSYARPREPNA
jgi:flagellar biogenesis protein FliO